MFGTIVDQKLPTWARSPVGPVDTDAKSVKELRDVSMAELQKHNTPEDCWIGIAGTVYDFTAFAEEHPSGAQSIHDLAGKDGTATFQAVHNMAQADCFSDTRTYAKTNARTYSCTYTGSDS